VMFVQNMSLIIRGMKLIWGKIPIDFDLIKLSG